MTKIHQLDNLLINQIAAGEVVSRPASIIKELLENSIDAGSTKIDIEITQGGIESISVIDNGSGINKEDLHLALSRHATSKIAKLEELNNINSLGFRGEALASTSSVAKISIASLALDAAAAWQINSSDGITTQVVPVAHNLGTTVRVNSLFFNIPARRKFLRLPKTEFYYCEKVVRQIVLSSFDISFSFHHNQKLIYQLPATTNKSQRLALLYSQELVNNLIHIKAQHDQYSITGWLGVPTFSRSRGDIQWLFINGRAVKDKLINHAVRQAYNDLLYRDRFPIFILYLHVPTNEVDVNVHPAKTEVKFHSSEFIISFVIRALRASLAKINPSTQLSPPVNLGAHPTPANHSDAEREQEQKKTWHNKAISAQTQSTSVNKQGTSTSAHKQNYTYQTHAKQAQEQLPAAAKFFALDKVLNPQPNIQNSLPLNASAPNNTTFANAIANNEDRLKNTEKLQNTNNIKDTDTDIHKSNSNLDLHPLGYALGQIGLTFIIAENQQGLVIVDTHAAHERIIYERLKSQYHEKCVACQKLLLAIKIDTNQAETDCITSHKHIIEKMGFSFIPSIDGISITGVPMLLKDHDISHIFNQIISDLIKYGSTHKISDNIDNILAQMACRNAIKTNERLSIEQMNSLLREIETIQFSGQCNHGRPTWVCQSLEQMDKLFLRGR